MYLLNLTLTICAGIVLANLALEMGVFRHLGRVLNPLFHTANISPEVGASAMARMFSPSAGYSTLAQFYHSGRVEEKSVIITTFIASFPYELLRILKFYLPVAIPLLGLSLGAKYIAVKVGSGFLQTALALTYSRFRLPGVVAGGESENEPSLKRALSTSLQTLKRVIPLFLLTFGGVRLLLSQGLLSPLASLGEPLTAIFSLPGEASLLIATMLANVVAGFATGGELLREGLLSEEEALITLLAGLVVTLPRIFLQHTAPVVSSLFPKKVALKMISIKISIEATTLLFMLAVVVRWS